MNDLNITLDSLESYLSNFFLNGWKDAKINDKKRKKIKTIIYKLNKNLDGCILIYHGKLYYVNVWTDTIRLGDYQPRYLKRIPWYKRIWITR